MLTNGDKHYPKPSNEKRIAARVEAAFRMMLPVSL